MRNHSEKNKIFSSGCDFANYSNYITTNDYIYFIINTLNIKTVVVDCSFCSYEQLQKLHFLNENYIKTTKLLLIINVLSFFSCCSCVVGGLYDYYKKIKFFFYAIRR